jgi:hypothetical protein
MTVRVSTRRRGRGEEAGVTLPGIVVTLTGERMMTKDTGGRDRPSRDEIARLAYHLYETRGQRDCLDVDD